MAYCVAIIVGWRLLRAGLEGSAARAATFRNSFLQDRLYEIAMDSNTSCFDVNNIKVTYHARHGFYQVG